VDNNNNTNIGVFISPIFPNGNNQSLFHVCKGSNTNTVSIGCNITGQSSSTTINGKLYLSNNTNSTEFSCLSNEIQFTKKDSSDTVIIPYGTDLSNIGTGQTVEDIKTINPYLGIDEYYTLEQDESIPFARNEKFFQYYRQKNVFNGLYAFGVVVQAYTDKAALNLININKYNNKIHIGCDHYSNSSQGTNDFSSSTIIGGDLQICNTNGIYIITNTNQAVLTVNLNDVSFKDYVIQTRILFLLRVFELLLLITKSCFINQEIL
jgi:hypothetical protein